MSVVKLILSGKNQKSCCSKRVRKYSVLGGFNISGLSTQFGQQLLDSGKLALHLEVFQDLCRRWRMPDMDLLGSKFNKQLDRSSQGADSLEVAVDALVAQWDQVSTTWPMPFLLWNTFLDCSARSRWRAFSDLHSSRLPQVKVDQTPGRSIIGYSRSSGSSVPWLGLPTCFTVVSHMEDILCLVQGKKLLS